MTDIRCNNERCPHRFNCYKYGPDIAGAKGEFRTFDWREDTCFSPSWDFPLRDQGEGESSPPKDAA